MRFLSCWLAVATVLALVGMETTAAAAPTTVNVRIEGRSETLFEGPLLTDVHRVRAISDTKWRRCDGVDASLPGVVPTSAAAGAMRIPGQGFDGRWYPQWNDYFITGWGPDSEDPGANEYWGAVVNNFQTGVGGCQYQLDDGDEVLWIYDAFAGRVRLALYPAGYAGGAEPLTASATLNQPFELEVGSWPSSSVGKPPASPARTSTPYEGAEVAPVITAASGFQRADVASPETVVSGAGGKASITFTTPGWHRIKATDVVAGVEVAIRSNRLDVCVPQPPASGCGTLPVDDQVRVPPPPVPGEGPGDGEPGGGESPAGDDGSQPGSGGGAGDGGSGSTPGPLASPGRVRVRASLDRSRLARGALKLSWLVLEPGSGIASWTVSSRRLGRGGARWVGRARGRERSATTLRLPAGAAYQLRLTLVDARGASSTVPLGRVRVPE